MSLKSHTRMYEFNDYFVLEFPAFAGNYKKYDTCNFSNPATHFFLQPEVHGTKLRQSRNGGCYGTK